jgi:hypothetical protein
VIDHKTDADPPMTYAYCWPPDDVWMHDFAPDKFSTLASNTATAHGVVDVRIHDAEDVVGTTPA